MFKKLALRCRFPLVLALVLKNALVMALATCGIYAHLSEASIIYTSNLFSPADPYGLSPYWNWKTIESEHFRVTFPEELKAVAKKATGYLEEAHSLLSPVLRWEPHTKAQILLIDNQDLANGLTSPIGRFGIILWVTPPDSWGSTNYYDDWLRLLVIHEYTHFLNMDTTTSFWASLRPIFGDLLLPNSAWPPWMLEGLAVYMETQFTTAGRGRSPDYEMLLRAAVADNTLNTREFVTLDQINGDNPYFPGGDTRYQFGYQLMNQVSKEAQDPKFKLFPFDDSEDHDLKKREGTEILGIMSKRSGARIPFFINGNLENITGKDWYQFWNEWVAATQKRTNEELKRIQSQPTTHFKLLTEQNHQISNQVLGVAASPDGKWLAYTQSSADQRQGLFIRNIQSGEIKRIGDKLYGIGMKFTPDSKTLIYSGLHRKSQYYLYSDLETYHLEKKSKKWLSDGLRARDPDISNSGNRITFTLTETAVTGLAIAPLIAEGDNYKLGPIEKLYMPPAYDLVGNPRFSMDGSKIYFSLHPNGKSQEDLMEYDLRSHQVSTLIADGKYNRFPIVINNLDDNLDGLGELYYISNATGVDNLYHYDGYSNDHHEGAHAESHKTGHLVTNMTTGINFPCFGPLKNSHAILYASVFSSSGWDLAEVELLQSPIDSAAITLSPPPAPPLDPRSTPQPNHKDYTVQDYSIFPSILPRVWSPLLGIDSGGFTVGGELLGFDATNQHRYMLGGTYNTQLQYVDGFALYSNRSLGPAITFSSDVLTQYFNRTSDYVTYSRQMDLSTSISYPLIQTYSTLSPTIAFNYQQLWDYVATPDFSQKLLYYTQRAALSMDASLIFNNLETSDLSISPEEGTYSVLGARLYLNLDQPIWKALWINQDYFRIAKHTVISPSFKGLWSSQISPQYFWANSILEGRIPNQIIGAFNGNGFDLLSLRGYPNHYYVSNAATVAAVDLTFPLARIFGGWGTNPFFLDNLYGNVFAEVGYLPPIGSPLILPSAGGAIRLSSEIFFIPLTFSAEYQYGFRLDRGGGPDLFFQVLTQGLSF